ncbi:MAG TPA: (2Fe-2S)-binding protein [Verrucomicrobia bacterium]|nr:(2Fe-2S)-binding protein [Verrucomicrobiota bacterium]HOB31900.1 (2Fe-2S)-binding protein [Verrucomicrobiota bacterium]HOP96381.1 (2Fe-2S)-binding protein [Verrucomicrobiota bacterium]HPU57312.1 (2Fe-2S)-binding protein [Verrucomicrobiota bacterium]
MSESSSKEGFAVSRRSFLKTFGTTAAAAATAQVETIAAELQQANAERVVGPGAVPITLQINGKAVKLELEPRVTLLDALRNHLSYTGAKEVCDRATCGACTVLVDDQPVYACSMLAIEAQGKAITTVEGLAENGRLSPVQEAFVDQDALMCGYCTPGFVMSVTALLKRNPKPTAEDVKHACAGNLCRCGTQPRILQAALKAAGVQTASKTEVISYARLA